MDLNNGTSSPTIITMHISRDAPGAGTISRDGSGGSDSSTAQNKAFYFSSSASLAEFLDGLHKCGLLGITCTKRTLGWIAVATYLVAGTWLYFFLTGLHTNTEFVA